MIARLRRLLLVPAAALILIGAPALAVDEPTLPRPTTTRVPLDAAVMAATGLLYLAILTAFGTDLVARATLA